MRVVYDPRRVLHHPATEVQYGIAMRIYEVPARARGTASPSIRGPRPGAQRPLPHGAGRRARAHHRARAAALGISLGPDDRVYRAPLLTAPASRLPTPRLLTVRLTLGYLSINQKVTFVI